MTLTLDFDHNQIHTEQGTLEAPGLSDKKKEIFALLGIEEILGEELCDEIDALFNQLGLDAVANRK